MAKLEEIYQAVVDACPHEVLAIRSAFAVTLVSQYPFRHIQIVTRLYNSPAEILMGFDVDSCAVRLSAFDPLPVEHFFVVVSIWSHSVLMSMSAERALV